MIYLLIPCGWSCHVPKDLELDTQVPGYWLCVFCRNSSPSLENAHDASPAWGEMAPLPLTPTRPDDQTSITWLSEDKIIELACVIGMASLALGWHLSSPAAERKFLVNSCSFKWGCFLSWIDNSTYCI